MSNSDNGKRKNFFKKLFRAFKRSKSGKLERQTSGNLESGEASETSIENLNVQARDASYEIKNAAQSRRDVNAGLNFGSTENRSEIIVTERIRQRYSGHNEITSNTSQSFKRTDSTYAGDGTTNILGSQKDKRAASVRNVSVGTGKDINSGSDRNLNMKIMFLERDHRGIENIHRSSERDSTKCSVPFSKSPNLVPSNPTKILHETHKFILKETKIMSEGSSEDSDLSADLTDDSFEESSEDENELLIDCEKNEKKLKDEYFMKGKYLSYFFLEMERQFYDPSDVYSMVQYHESNIEKPGKKGIIN